MRSESLRSVLDSFEERPLSVPEAPSGADLKQWRDHIDEIDRILLHFINERSRSANAIGQIKQHLDLPIYAPRREQAVIENVLSANQGPLSNRAVRRIFERLIDETRSLERQKYQK